MEPTAIREDESVASIFESMESSCIAHELVSWAEVEVEGVCQDEFDGWEIAYVFGILEHIEYHAFDGCLGSYGHETGSRECHAVEGDLSDSCVALLGEYLEI